MSENKKFITVFSGSEVEVILLKGLLENEAIEGIIQNDFQSSIHAGFAYGTVSTVRLKLHESDIKKAKPIIEDFLKHQL